MNKYFIVLLFLATVKFTQAQPLVIEKIDVQTIGTLTVTATTISYNGTYAPRNVVSIWIQDSSGKFVKSLLVYANSRIQYLTNWVTSSAKNKVDAISGATQSIHGIRSCSWNGTNTARDVLADGTYTVKIEMTESNGTGKVGIFTFVKGPTEQTVTPSNISGFSNVSIKWTPTFTGVDEVELSKLYTVYPNPTKSFVFVKGIGIQRIELFTLLGESILRTAEQKIDLSKLTNGIYLAVIKTKQAVFIKKINKE